jgi:hypothetical protein
MSISDINNAAQRLTEAGEAYHGKIAEINARISSKESQVDTFIDTAQSKLAKPLTLVYDETVVHYKSDPITVADPADDTRSNWVSVNTPLTSYLYTLNPNNQFAVMNVSRIFGAPGGYYENPQYDTDHSVTRMQFILAPTEVTSDQINNYIEVEGLEIPSIRQWSYGAYSIDLPILMVPDAGTGFKLYMRFINAVYDAAPEVPDNAEPQNILSFGGDSSFVVQTVKVFRK